MLETSNICRAIKKILSHSLKDHSNLVEMRGNLFANNTKWDRLNVERDLGVKRDDWRVRYFSKGTNNYPHSTKSCQEIPWFFFYFEVFLLLVTSIFFIQNYSLLVLQAYVNLPIVFFYKKPNQIHSIDIILVYNQILLLKDEHVYATQTLISLLWAGYFILWNNFFRNNFPTHLTLTVI